MDIQCHSLLSLHVCVSVSRVMYPPPSSKYRTASSLQSHPPERFLCINPTSTFWSPGNDKPLCISTVFLFQECCIHESRWHVTFRGRLFSHCPQTCPGCCMCHFPFSWLSNIPGVVLPELVQPSNHGRTYDFQYFTIMNKAAMNTCVHFFA